MTPYTCTPTQLAAGSAHTDRMRWMWFTPCRFIEVLAAPPKSAEVVTQYTQQALLARKRAASLRRARDMQEKEQTELRRLREEMEAHQSKLMEAAIRVQEEERLANEASATNAAIESVMDNQVAAAALKRQADAEAAAAREEEEKAAALVQEQERAAKLAQRRVEAEAEARVRKAQAEANAATAAAEQVRRAKEATEQAQRDDIARQQKLLEDKVKANIGAAAATSSELTDWHTPDQVTNLDPNSAAYRMAKIEEAERQAIAETVVGSNEQNDDAILRAMAATNPAAYQSTMTRSLSTRSTRSMNSDSNQRSAAAAIQAEIKTNDTQSTCCKIPCMHTPCSK